MDKLNKSQIKAIAIQLLLDLAKEYSMLPDALVEKLESRIGERSNEEIDAIVCAFKDLALETLDRHKELFKKWGYARKTTVQEYKAALLGTGQVAFYATPDKFVTIKKLDNGGYAIEGLGNTAMIFDESDLRDYLIWNNYLEQ